MAKSKKEWKRFIDDAKYLGANIRPPVAGGNVRLVNLAGIHWGWSAAFMPLDHPQIKTLEFIESITTIGLQAA